MIVNTPTKVAICALIAGFMWDRLALWRIPIRISSRQSFLLGHIIIGFTIVIMGRIFRP